MPPDSGSSCPCHGWSVRVRRNLGYETADLLVGFVVRRERNPWLRLLECRGCGRTWYVAVDTVDDDYYFRRLAPAEEAAIVEHDVCPTDFDQFVNVWPWAEGQEHRARLHWPWQGEDIDDR